MIMLLILNENEGTGINKKVLMNTQWLSAVELEICIARGFCCWAEHVCKP
jgi:hypothetical protein